MRKAFNVTVGICAGVFVGIVLPVLILLLAIGAITR